MSTRQTRNGHRALRLATAMALALLVQAGGQWSTALAQGTDQGPPSGGNGPGVPPGQGPGGFPGRAPFVMGTVTGEDKNGGVITVSSPFGGTGDQTIRVSANTKYYTQATVSASALKVGDQVRVNGVPTAITASQVTIGQIPDFLRMGPPGMAGGQGGNRSAQQQAFASATGKVISTSPLTIEVSDSVSVVLKLAADARVSKITQATLASLKTGDRIMAVGQEGDDGSLVATGIGINMTTGGGPGMGGRGFGGFPGRGAGGPGGPGGPPPDGPDGPGGPPPDGPGGPPPNGPGGPPA